MLGTRGCVCSSHSHKSKLGPPGGATNTGPLHGIPPSCFQTVGSDEFWFGTRFGDVELDDRGKFGTVNWKMFADTKAWEIGGLWMSQTGSITGMNLSISAWPNVLKFFLRNLVSLEAPAPKTGPPDGIQAKVKKSKVRTEFLRCW